MKPPGASIEKLPPAPSSPVAPSELGVVGVPGSAGAGGVVGPAGGAEASGGAGAAGVVGVAGEPVGPVKTGGVAGIKGGVMAGACARRGIRSMVFWNSMAGASTTGGADSVAVVMGAACTWPQARLTPTPNAAHANPAFIV